MQIFDPNGLAVRYRPVSLLGQNHVTLYRCLPISQVPDKSTQRGTGLILHAKGTRETATKNALILKAALSELVHAHENGKPVRIIVPINTHALVGKEETSSIVSLFRQVDGDIRRSIIVELFDFPKMLTLETLEDSLIPLFPFIDTFIAQPKSDMKDYTVFANCNFFGVSIDFDDAPEDPSQLKRLTQFWASATKSRLKMFVEGINSDEIIENAKRYEALGMDGPAVGSDLDSLLENPAPEDFS